jgi:hypothetical protein
MTMPIPESVRMFGVGAPRPRTGAMIGRLSKC